MFDLNKEEKKFELEIFLKRFLTKIIIFFFIFFIRKGSDSVWKVYILLLKIDIKIMKNY